MLSERIAKIQEIELLYNSLESRINSYKNDKNFYTEQLEEDPESEYYKNQLQEIDSRIKASTEIYNYIYSNVCKIL